MSLIEFNCDNCGKGASAHRSHYMRKKRHFCSRECYSAFRAEKLPPEEQNAWKGGITPEESRRKYTQKNKDKVRAMNKARRLRELNAPGSHTKEEWEQVKRAANNQCAMKDDTCRGSITKDHVVPLVMNGSNDVGNLQVLCRSHNSRKTRQVYLGTWTEVSA